MACVSQAILDNLSSSISRLTPREKEMLLRLARGLPNRKIAAQLSISVETIKHHRKIIKSKLEVSSSADFIRYAQAFKLEETLRKR